VPAPQDVHAEVPKYLPEGHTPQEVEAVAPLTVEVVPSAQLTQLVAALDGW
jgi:hypothetical protein